MKRALIFGVVAILAMAAQAMAASIVLTVNDPHDSSGGGGPFTMTLTEGSLVVNGTTLATSGAVFTTFCIERSEYFYPGTSYIATINPYEKAINGGLDPGIGGDTLSKASAWLFGTYSQKGFSTTQDATYFQQALWYLEDEITLGTPLDNPYLSLVNSNFGGINKGTNAALGEYGVYVVNLTDSGGGVHQDQLILVPDGGFTVMLLGLGIGGLALFSRKLKA
jgi:hypothetical protein